MFGLSFLSNINWKYVLISLIAIFIIAFAFKIVNTISFLSSELKQKEIEIEVYEGRVRYYDSLIEEAKKRVEEINSINTKLNDALIASKKELDSLRRKLKDTNLSSLPDKQAEKEFNTWFQSQLDCLERKVQCK